VRCGHITTNPMTGIMVECRSYLRSHMPSRRNAYQFKSFKATLLLAKILALANRVLPMDAAANIQVSCPIFSHFLYHIPYGNKI